MPSIKSLVLFGASAAFAEVFKVDVGKDGLKIEPANVKAAKGDTIIFSLYPQHDLAESNFDKPCLPKDFGIYSGQYKDTDEGKKKFVMNVTTTDPIYYYCTVPKHCNSGMVGGINLPDGDKSLDAYTNAAKNAKDTRRPAKINGGQLLDDAAIASLLSSAAPTGTGAPTGVPTGTDGPKPTGNSTVSLTSFTDTGAPKPTSTGGNSDAPPPPPATTTGTSTHSASPSPTGAAGIVSINLGLAAVMAVLAFAL